MFSRKIFALSLIICLVASSAFASRDNYNKAWEEFNNNNRNKAREYFETAVKSEPESKSEALLSLVLLDWFESKDKAAFNRFQEFYQSCDNPYPYLYAMYSLPFMSPKQILSPSEIGFFEKIVNDPKMHGTLKAMLYQKIGEHYMSCNDFQKSKKAFEQMGAINQWQVLGSFDNISGSGFDKNWGALEKSAPDSRFRNKVEAAVSWYTPLANKPDNWFYFDYYFPPDNIIVYAQSFVQSPEEKDIVLRTGTSGSLKIWVNDTQIANIPEERNCDLDIYSYKIKLNKGANRILVQIGQSEISAANFLMRLTDADGNPVQGLGYSANYSEYTQSKGKASNELLPFFAEVFFQEKIKNDPDNPLNYIALGEVFLRNDKSYEGITTLKKVEQMAPKSSYISYRLSEGYLRSQNRTNYSREIENIKQNDPESYIALVDLYNDAVETEKYTEAGAIANKIKMLYGENYASDMREINLLDSQKKIDELIQLVKQLYVKYPSDAAFMGMMFFIEESIYKNSKGATAIMENYNKKYFNANVMERLAERYIQLGETNKGLNLYKKRIELIPYATGYRSSYAGLLQKMQKYKEALAELDEVKKQTPYLSSIYSAEGYIYKETKEIEKSKESFRKSIYYDPNAYDSRTQLRLLDSKKEVFDLFPKVKLDSLIAKSPSQNDYPEESAVLVLHDVQLVFYPEGAQENRTELAIKILNQKGIEEWKEYQIGYGSNQKLILDKYEIIKANGQKVKAETNNQGRVVFTNIEVGDILHLDYRLQSYLNGILSKHFYDYSLLQYSMPVVQSSYSILIPKDKKFQYVVRNSDIKPVTSDIEDMKLYQWTCTDKPAIKDEIYMSPLVDIAPTLIFSSIPDWKFIGEWYRDLSSNKIKANSDYILKETHSEILKGKENASPIEKAKLFYEYILNNITYSNVSFMQSNFIPQKASRTITTRLGDCKDVSTLFVTLCRESGIRANLVLLSSRENGKNLLALPSILFNHCIARLEADGRTYYLELTDNKLPFGAALDYDLQSNILPIPYKDEPTVNDLLTMDMPFRMKNDIRRETKVNVAGNDMNVVYSSVRRGQLASFQRQLYADMGADDRLKDLNQIIASEWNTPVKASNLTYTNMNNLSDTVTSKYDLEIKNALQDVAGMKIFRLPWSDAIKSLEIVALENRKFPIEFWASLFCDSEEETIELILPQGKKLVETPQNVKLESPAASYELTYTANKNGTVSIKRLFTKKKDVILPEEYDQFKTFMNAVSENDNKQYAIK